uniref:alanine--tRNA ligase n=1 Tax=Rhipicephalus pulchellus TaxID=72859 RepID=L7LYR0_RHIPC
MNAAPGTFASLVPVVVEILGDAFPELKKDPESVMDIINEEESQFLKTLSRGRRLLEKTVGKLGDQKFLPGDVAWRLYDTYGFPIDLTQLMVEEKGLAVDMESYEKAKQAAQLASQGGDNKVDVGLKLDVHAISELQAKGVPSTDDLPKYDYSARSEDKNASYEFAPCYGTVLVLRTNKTFVDSVEAGHQCGVILDRTNFYAESGGQSCDTGFMTSEENEDVEFAVNEVHVQGGYVIHIGRLGSGTLKVGDKLKLSIDEERRKLLMNNHTGTHVLNFALRQVLTAEADQRGSLVAPDRLRFDFANKKPMSPAEVKAAEQHANEMIAKNEVVYAKDSPLPLAKAIQGLRAVFNETYPDPVRVVSIGIPVEELLEDPSSPAGSITSVEFCGGTHLKRAGHVGDFVISTEEAIAKGIRRIVALTGPEATKAVKKAEHYQSEVNRLRTEVEKVTQAAQGKELVKQIVELTEEISQSSISYWKKDELRTDLKNLKKKLDDLDRSNKAQAQQLAIETVKKLLEDKKDCDYIVHTLEVGDNAKALDAALKQVRTLTPNAAAMFLSQDTEKGKVICLSSVPKGIVARGLTANAWVKEVSDVIGGKGGGREESAQAIGNNVGSIEKALQVANEFAKLKLAC